MKIEPRTLKGFRDFLPKEAWKRQYVIETLQRVFESYGFEPLETPTLEYEDILIGKYGEEGDKLMYRFEDNGGRRVALRYDQTVPLARVIAKYRNGLIFPFKRYQIQNVFRAENTQRGRFREFLQCDVDTIGNASPISDAEIIALAYQGFLKLGFTDFKFIVNDRATFKDLSKGTIASIDKIKKIGQDKVIEELVARGEYDEYENAKKVLVEIESTTPTPWIENVINSAQALGVPKENISFDPYLARGLDYYTSTIIEVEAREYTGGSLGGGGRYDNLIGMFSGENIPAVGFAFGFDRIIEAMEELSLFPDKLKKTQFLVTVFSDEFRKKSEEAALYLREKGYNAELYLEENAKMDKQLKYADRKSIPFVVIIGPEETEKNEITVKNLASFTQSKIPLTEIATLLSSW